MSSEEFNQLIKDTSHFNIGGNIRLEHLIEYPGGEHKIEVQFRTIGGYMSWYLEDFTFETFLDLIDQHIKFSPKMERHIFQQWKVGEIRNRKLKELLK